MDGITHRRSEKKREAVAVWLAAGRPGHDWADYAKELIKDGWPEEAIDEEIRLYRAQMLDAEPWPENIEVIEVYVASMPVPLAAMTQVLMTGISSQEIIATCIARRVPRSRWWAVLTGCREMFSAAAELLNKKR